MKKILMNAVVVAICAVAAAVFLRGMGLIGPKVEEPASQHDHDSHEGHDHGSHEAGDDESHDDDGCEDHGHGDAPDRHKEQDWCAEHNVAESACTRCNPGLTAQFKAKGDWCAEHAVPESQCVLCNPGAGAAHGDGHECDSHGALAQIEQKKCEHGSPILQCNECRYQAGVVKIEPSVAGALLSTARAEVRPATRTLKLTGRVELDPTRAVEVVPLSAGVVTDVKAFLGDHVSRGDVLAVIRSGDLGEAKAAFMEVDAAFQAAKINLERERKLRDERISSKAELLNAEKEHLIAAAQRAAAQKRLFVLGLTDEQIAAIARENGTAAFTDLALKSPRTGTLIVQNIVEGKFVEDTEHLYTVADLSGLWVWCDLYERDLGILHARLLEDKTIAANVMVRAFPGTRFPGRIDLIGSTVDEHTRTVKVRVRVPNEDGKLKPGMFATVEVRLDAVGGLLSVPGSAVLRDEDKSFVFQQWKNNFWVRRDVEIAAVQDGTAQIAGGLPEGAVVVTGGGFMLKSDVLRNKMGAG